VDPWTANVINGIPVLMRSDALKAWREQKKIYDYGILIKIQAMVEEDGYVARPSVKSLYDADKQGMQWKDPFVNGPQ
jgi:hypothetical protein